MNKAGVHLIEAPREIDIAERSTMEAMPGECVARPGCTLVIVDCRQLTFLDSTGVYVLVAARRQALRNGQDVRLTNVSGAPLRILRTLGAADYFSLPGSTVSTSPT